MTRVAIPPIHVHVPIPRLYLGTMTFGWSQTSAPVDETVAKAMVNKFITFNQKQKPSPSDSDSSTQHYIDTARIYAGGATEPIVGATIADAASYCDRDGHVDSLLLGTKAHPSQANGLSATGIRQQFDASIEAMSRGVSVSSVAEYYLHQPDPNNSLLESLKCLNELVKEKKVQRVGMSNYHVSEVKRAFDLCQEHGLAKPTVYQGLYNPLNRMVESELLPLLKEHGCAFVAYNPLAAGLLTGKHINTRKSIDVKSGRFKDNQNYLPRFYTDDNFNAINLIQKACDEETEGITMIEATFRWLLRHSALSGGEQDGILLGASSLTQLDENLNACLAGMEKGDLPVGVLKAFDDAWAITEKSAFPYWRSYSSDMPGGKDLDQGAAYSASKK
jgi:aflatoxin B1 aldehyde reductase